MDRSKMKYITVKLTPSPTRRLGIVLRPGFPRASVIGTILPNSTAADNGKLMPGDIIFQINGELVDVIGQKAVNKKLRNARAHPMKIKVIRGCDAQFVETIPEELEDEELM